MLHDRSHHLAQRWVTYRRRYALGDLFLGILLRSRRRPATCDRCPASRIAPKVLALVAQGRSYRLVGREVGLSKNTVAGIVARARGLGRGSGKPQG